MYGCKWNLFWYALSHLWCSPGLHPGPTVIFIYINDLPETTNFAVKLYAKDTALIMKHNNSVKLLENVNSVIKHIEKWMEANKLTINYTESEFMIVTHKKLKHTFEIKINTICLTEADSVKYFGVLIDKNLTWKPHIAAVSTKVASGSWVLTKLKRYVNQKTHLTVYYSIIFPYVQYCFTAWGSCSHSNLTPFGVIIKTDYSHYKCCWLSGSLKTTFFPITTTKLGRYIFCWSSKIYGFSVIKSR